MSEKVIKCPHCHGRGVSPVGPVADPFDIHVDDCVLCQGHLIPEGLATAYNLAFANDPRPLIPDRVSILRQEYREMEFNEFFKQKTSS